MCVFAFVFSYLLCIVDVGVVVVVCLLQNLNASANIPLSFKFFNLSMCHFGPCPSELRPCTHIAHISFGIYYLNIFFLSLVFVVFVFLFFRTLM